MRRASKGSMRDWSSEDDMDNEGDDFTPGRQPAKRRKTVDYDEKPDMEAGSTMYLDGDFDQISNPAPRRGRPPGRRNHQSDEDAMGLAPFMLSERRSTRAVVAAIQDAMEPRHIAAARDCAMFNSKLMIERHRMGPVYMDKNTNALIAFNGHRAPYFPPETQGTPVGYEPYVSTTVRTKRQTPEQFYLASLAELHDSRAYDGNPIAFATFKEKFLSGWSGSDDAATTYQAPAEVASTPAPMPRFTSTRAAAAAAMASFQSPSGILSNISAAATSTPSSKGNATRALQAINRVARGGSTGGGRRRAARDSAASDDDEAVNTSVNINDEGDYVPVESELTAAEKAAAFSAGIVCADCHDATLEEPLQCSQCRSLHHASCLRLAVRTVDKARAYAWRCNDCKLCESCQATGDEEKLLMCDSCDRGYHTYCLKPPLEALPEGEWVCEVCISQGVQPSAPGVTHEIAMPQPSLNVPAPPKKRGRPPKSDKASQSKQAGAGGAGRKRKRTAIEDFDEFEDEMDDDDDEDADVGGDDDGDYKGRRR